MNITIDNYEAYLLDYLEGKLSPEGATQLHAFMKAQGLDYDILTEDLPHLTAPQIEFKDKERLKKKGAVVPLYVKITSAAAAAGLLLTVSLWPDKHLPRLEPVAEPNPIEAKLTVTETPVHILPPKPVHFAEQKHANKENKKMAEKNMVETITLLPLLKPQEAIALTDDGFPMEPDPNLLRYQMETRQSLTYLPKETLFEEELPSSWIAKGIYRMTEGRYSNIGGLINAGLHIAKKEVVKASTDIALTAYNHADEHFEKTMERWEEKRKE